MKIILILIATLLIASCSSSGGKIADKTYYRFPAVTQTPIDKNIKIKKPTAMGILANRPMVVQGIDGGMVQMNHNFWLESPKLLLYNYLNKRFISKLSENNNQLNSQILSLEKKGNYSILAIKFILVDGNENEIINKTYRDEEVLVENNIPTFVKSISNSIEKLVQQFIDDLSILP